MVGSASTPADRMAARRGELPFCLDTRDEITNYFAWQASLFARHLGGRVVDHGAGTGSLTAAVLARGVDSLVALEPDPELVALLERRFSKNPEVQVVSGTVADYLASAGPTSVDCIVSSNVLEHIDDDRACLSAMWQLLRPGGALGLYLPARPELFGSLDTAVGHCRRYTRTDLGEKLGRAGFRVEHLSYRNLVGVLPWLVTGRIWRRQRIGRGSLRLFDKLVFPLARRLEDLAPPPYGLNLVAIATRP
jgi:SAM-dependent methyltransferase